MTWKKMLLGVIIGALSFFIGAYYRFNSIEVPTRPAQPVQQIDLGETTSADVTEGDSEPNIPPIEISGRINILVLGEDNVESVKRSDTMMFVAVDIDEKNVRVLSLPRDTRVAIPRHGNQKLNHAYAYGGVELLRATIERFLGTPIHYYVKIDYDNFPQLVDIVGGVDIFVGKAMKYTDRKQKLFIDIPQGKQRMNGETALKYVRFRNDALGDIGRIRRQQQFLKGFLHRIYETDNLLRFPTVMDQIKNTLTTDMDPSMILQLGSFLRRLENDQDKIFFKMLPGEAAMVDGLSYWIPNRAGVESFITSDWQTLTSGKANDVTTAADYSPDSADNKKKDPEPDETVTDTGDLRESIRAITVPIAVLNGTGKAGIAQNVATELQKLGIDVTHTGNAKHFDYKSCIIIYPEKASQEMRQTAEALAKMCGVAKNLTRADRQATYVSLVVGHNYGSLLKKLENDHAALR